VREGSKMTLLEKQIKFLEVACIFGKIGSIISYIRGGVLEMPKAILNHTLQSLFSAAAVTTI